MKLIKNNKKEKGFTLIELVVVIAILAILALILIPSLSGYKTKADKSKDEANARNIYTAATLLLDEDEIAKADTNGKGDLIKTKINAEGLVDTKQIDNWADVTITVDADGKILVEIPRGQNEDPVKYPSN